MSDQDTYAPQIGDYVAVALDYTVGSRRPAAIQSIHVGAVTDEVVFGSDCGSVWVRTDGTVKNLGPQIQVGSLTMVPVAVPIFCAMRVPKEVVLGPWADALADLHALAKERGAKQQNSLPYRLAKLNALLDELDLDLDETPVRLQGSDAILSLDDLECLVQLLDEGGLE